MFGKAFVLATLMGSSMAMAAGPARPTPLASGQSGYAMSPAEPSRGGAAALALGSGTGRGGVVFEAAALRSDRDQDRRGGFDRDDRGRSWRDHDREGGWSRDRDRDDVRFRGEVNIHIGRPPVVVAPAPIVLPARYDVRPYELSLRAVQAGETVIVFAEGSNRTGGYTTKLDIVSGGYGQARVVLKNLAPSGCEVVTQCVSPFSEQGYFTSCERLREIKVCVAGQEVCVAVEQVRVLR